MCNQSIEMSNSQVYCDKDKSFLLKYAKSYLAATIPHTPIHLPGLFTFKNSSICKLCEMDYFQFVCNKGRIDYSVLLQITTFWLLYQYLRISTRISLKIENVYCNKKEIYINLHSSTESILLGEVKVCPSIKFTHLDQQIPTEIE